MNLYQSTDLKDKSLTDEEKYLCQQFKTAKSLDEVMKNTNLDKLKAFNVFLKMIEQENIRICVNTENKLHETFDNLRARYKSYIENRKTTTQGAADTQSEVNKLNLVKDNDVPEIQAIRNPNIEPINIDNSEDYTSLYNNAMAAYVRRNYTDSLVLFEKCQRLDPDDTRVKHNIEKLKERLH